jgi:hypothetical protein
VKRGIRRCELDGTQSEAGVGKQIADGESGTEVTEKVIVQVVNSFHVMFCVQILQSRLSRKSFPRSE